MNQSLSGLTLSQTANFWLLQTERLADDNFEFEKKKKKGRKFSKRVENDVGKGEIARYEQFILFLQFFQKTCTADTQKPGLVWERVKKASEVIDLWAKEHAYHCYYSFIMLCFMFNK